MIVCPRCSQENEDAATNCANCGIDLQRTTLFQYLREASQRDEAELVPEGRAKRKLGGEYTSNEAKVRDLIIGIAGWFAVNGAIWLLISGKVYIESMEGALVELFFFLPANALVLVLFLFLRRWIAWGMLAAVAVNLIVSLVLDQGAGICGIPFFISLLAGGPIAVRKALDGDQSIWRPRRSPPREP